MTKIIDLRSDTVTKPTGDMLQVMMSAEVGDDVYGEDPSVNALQESVAGMFGKEAGLFVPTGVLSNQLAIKAHTQPGDEVILDGESHIFQYETAAPSMMSAVQLNPIRSASWHLTSDEVRNAFRPSEYYYPRSRLVCIENTHNRSGGRIFPFEAMQSIADCCRESKIALHLDGARIWNAHVKTGITFADYGRLFDSISVCFSKGLGAPIGSMLLGSVDFIRVAHKFRKIFGGGMRQAGYLAAAAQFAVEKNVGRLETDHEHAAYFTEELSGCTTFSISREQVETNMVLMDFCSSSMTAGQAQAKLEDGGILIGKGAGNTLRAVFHLDITAQDVDDALQRIKTVFG